MQIELNEIKIADLVAGYSDKGDEGVVGYGGKLDIRPAYQREFIYKDKQREAVVDSVMNGFPLNVMYWARREDGSFEVMDGQQRTISLCQFAAGDFSYDMRFFANLTDAERERFLAYPLMVYVCEGTDVDLTGQITELSDPSTRPVGLAQDDTAFKMVAVDDALGKNYSFFPSQRGPHLGMGAFVPSCIASHNPSWQEHENVVK